MFLKTFLLVDVRHFMLSCSSTCFSYFYSAPGRLDWAGLSCLVVRSVTTDPQICHHLI